MKINKLEIINNEITINENIKNNKTKNNNSIIYNNSKLNGLDAMSNYNKVSFKGYESEYIDNLIQDIQNNDTKIDIIKNIENLSVKQKQDFIDKFCNVTGLPDIDEFNCRMIEHSKNVINNSAENSGAKVLWSGFHKNCSAAKGLALPGSDLDGWSVIIDGNQNDKNRFCGEIWKNTNPVFASIRHEFPYVFNIDELSEWTEFIDELAVKNNMDLKAREYEKIFMN